MHKAEEPLMANSDIIHAIESVAPYIILAVIIYGAVRFIIGVHRSTRKAGEAMSLSGQRRLHLKLAGYSFLAIPFLMCLIFMLMVIIYSSKESDVMDTVLFSIIFAFAVFFFLYGIYNLVRAYDIWQQEKSPIGRNRKRA
jgi:hypothetical protein